MRRLLSLRSRRLELGEHGLHLRDLGNVVLLPNQRCGVVDGCVALGLADFGPSATHRGIARGSPSIEGADACANLRGGRASGWHRRFDIIPATGRNHLRAKLGWRARRRTGVGGCSAWTQRLLQLLGVGANACRSGLPARAALGILNDRREIAAGVRACRARDQRVGAKCDNGKRQ